MELERLIADYGDFVYVITFIWTFLEGETFVIFAGFAAQQNLLSLTAIIAAAWAGSFAGDQFYFFMGRRYGPYLLKRFPRGRPGVEAALDWLRRYNTVFILSFRFIYGVRTFSSFAIGMAGVPPLRFLVLNFAAAGVWATSFAVTGYLLGNAFEAILGELVRGFGLVMLAVLAMSVWIVTFVHRRQQRKMSAAALLSPTDTGAAPP
ncbi:MAG: DedA family protein [Rhodospirillaceae bacterium]|nr:DedA family protein [Rhodospirillaceae bacterium]